MALACWSNGLSPSNGVGLIGGILAPCVAKTWPSWRPADAEVRRWRPRETRCTVAIARLHSPRKVSRTTAQLAAALLEGQEVTLVKDVEETDPHERLLRYVYLGEEMANARLVLNGYASA
jgi:hypothetical protein